MTPKKPSKDQIVGWTIGFDSLPAGSASKIPATQKILKIPKFARRKKCSPKLGLHFWSPKRRPSVRLPACPDRPQETPALEFRLQLRRRVLPKELWGFGSGGESCLVVLGGVLGGFWWFVNISVCNGFWLFLWWFLQWFLVAFVVVCHGFWWFGVQKQWVV